MLSVGSSCCTGGETRQLAIGQQIEEMEQAQSGSVQPEEREFHVAALEVVISAEAATRKEWLTAMVGCDWLAQRGVEGLALGLAAGVSLEGEKAQSSE